MGGVIQFMAFRDSVIAPLFGTEWDSVAIIGDVCETWYNYDVNYRCAACLEQKNVVGGRPF